MSKILVVAAHPDDEILGVGGTMAALSEQGHEVFVLIVTEGCSSQYQGQDVQRLIADKKACALQAGKLVGVRQVLFGDLPDMRLDTLPHVEINRVIERATISVYMNRRWWRYGPYRAPVCGRSIPTRPCPPPSGRRQIRALPLSPTPIMTSLPSWTEK